MDNRVKISDRYEYEVVGAVRSAIEAINATWQEMDARPSWDEFADTVFGTGLRMGVMEFDEEAEPEVAQAVVAAQQAITQVGQQTNTDIEAFTLRVLHILLKFAASMPEAEEAATDDHDEWNAPTGRYALETPY